MIAIVARTAKQVALGLMLTTLAACQSGGSGRLMPDSAPGITLSRASVDGDVATLTQPPLTVSVRGFWAGNGGQGLYVTYRNTGATPLTLPMTGWALTTRDAAAPLYQVLDVTGVDVAGAAPPVDSPRRLFTIGDDAPRALVVPPGATRSLSVGFARFGPEGREPVVGTRVDARIPMSAAPATLRFTCAGGAD